MTMDLWTSPDLIPFMAVTAHWISIHRVSRTYGQPTQKLELRSELIGFLRVPGHHSGEHLAIAFTHILDRIGISSQVSSISLLCIRTDIFMYSAWMDNSRQCI